MKGPDNIPVVRETAREMKTEPPKTERVELEGPKERNWGKKEEVECLSSGARARVGVGDYMRLLAAVLRGAGRDGDGE